MMETVAFFGAGMLGSGFIRAMRRRGLDVHVWNRTFDKANALQADGARAFASPVDAARGATRVHLCLRSDDSVDAALDAAMPAIAPDTAVVDHTTVSPKGVLARAERLADAGIAFMHAPVFAGPANALEGTGVMMCSGPQALYEKLKPALEPMTSRLIYFGERPEIAAVYKLLGNAMIAAVIGGLNDVFTIAEANGLTREASYRLFEFFHPEGQLSGRGKRMAAGDYKPTWTLEMAQKDVGLMLDAANGEPVPLLHAMYAELQRALDRGFGELDFAAIAK